MRGRAIPLSPARRLVGDLMHFAAAVPGVPVQRRMALGPAADARRGLADRPPWAAVFAKGFALVAAAAPALRRAYLAFPRPRLYEYPASVASVAVERHVGGEPAVLAVRAVDPAGRPLADTARVVRAAQAGPVEGVGEFRRALRVSRLPRAVRRPLWWAALNWGRVRPNYFGTFGVTSCAALGAESLHPVSPLAYTLTYGPVGPGGAADVRVVYDHRVADGPTVARALVALEAALNGAVADELREMVRATAGAAAVPAP